jgi:hypothetical protein
MAIALRQLVQWTTLLWRKPLTEAEERAIKLLTSCLSPTQRDQYETHRQFEVTGGDTGRRYRVRHGRQMNIESLDEKGRLAQLFCFTLESEVPVGDVLLAQKIALELFELEALSIANRLPHWYVEYVERFDRRCRGRR